MSALQQMRPINMGVIGPMCPEGNWRILTHDFVHRTHRDIFKIYYPVVLSDWWMDDWISHVYPDGNAYKLLSVQVSHHTEDVARVHNTAPGDPVRCVLETWKGNCWARCCEEYGCNSTSCFCVVSVCLYVGDRH